MSECREVRSIFKTVSLLFVILFLAACQKETIPVSDICSADKPHTVLEFGKYAVNVFGPNENVNPDIWEGPICITNTENQSACAIDVSLIKEITYNANNGKLAVVIFSGSNAENIQLDMDTCKIIKP